MLAAHNANSSPRAWDHVHHNTLRNLLRGLGIAIPEALRPTGPQAAGDTRRRTAT